MTSDDDADATSSWPDTVPDGDLDTDPDLVGSDGDAWVAVDESPQPRRPLGAQLAVRSEAALQRVGDAADWAVRTAPPAAVFGAEQLVRDWQHWRRNQTELDRISGEKALAARQGMIPARLETALKDAKEEARLRARLTVVVVAAAVLGLVFCSVIGFWVWEQWRWFGPAGMFAQFAAGKYYRQRWVMRVAPVWLPVFVVLDITGWRWWPWWIAAGLLLAACVARGLVMAISEPRVTARDRRSGDTATWTTVWNTVLEVMEDRGKNVTRGDATAPIGAMGDEVGVTFRAHCPDAITGEDVRAIERELGFVVNGSSWVLDPAAAGSGDLRICWRDPLPSTLAARREPLSLRYTSRFTVAHREGGRVTALNLARQKVFLAGHSGAGKSEAMQELIDAVCDMRDTRWVGIDVTESATLRQFQRQWNCDGVAHTHDDALAMLKALRVECKRRNKLLDQGMDADLDGRMDQWWVVSEKPGRHGLVLFVDELAALTANKECAEELVHLYDEARKSSLSLVAATPDMDAKRVPPPCRDQSGIKVGFSMPFPDAVLLFGKGSTQSGWEPYHLVPADQDQPNDAGKSYVLGNGYNRPELHRWPHMPSDEVVARNIARRHHIERVGAPRVADSIGGVGDDGIVDAEVVSDDDVAREAALRRALQVCGDRPGLPAAEAADALTAQERAAVRAAAPTRSTYFPALGRSERAHRKSDLVTALDGTDGASVANGDIPTIGRSV